MAFKACHKVSRQTLQHGALQKTLKFWVCSLAPCVNIRKLFKSFWIKLRQVDYSSWSIERHQNTQVSKPNKWVVSTFGANFCTQINHELTHTQKTRHVLHMGRVTTLLFILVFNHTYIKIINFLRLPIFIANLKQVMYQNFKWP